MDSSKLNQFGDDINNWSLEFLEQISHYPTNGEYTAGDLVQVYVFNVLMKKKNDPNDAALQEVEDNKRAELAVLHGKDLSESEKEIREHFLYGDIRRKLGRALSVYLEKQPNILHEGDRRGRLYRYKLTRPKIKSKDIATYVAKWMDLSGEEVNVRDLDKQVILWANEFHISQEHGTISTSHDSLISGALENYPREQLPPKFSFEDDTIMQNYQKTFNSDLSEWCSKVYTKSWYQSISSNVLRYLRKEFDCIAEGSKRGRWIHKNHLVKDNQSAMFDAVSEIAGLVDQFSVIHKKISNIENQEMRKSIANVLESHIQLMQGQIDIANINRDIFTGTKTWSGDSSELTLEEYLDRNHGIEPPKKETMRDKIKKFLGDRPRNTSEILEHINLTLRHGTTNEHLENILAKDKNFVKVGFIKRSNILNGEIDIVEWATRTWVSENAPDFDDEMHKIANPEDGVQS